MKRSLPLKQIFITIIQIPLNTVLCLLYLIMIFPYHLLGKKAARLQAYKNPGSYWDDIASHKDSLESLRRQF